MSSLILIEDIKALTRVLPENHTYISLMYNDDDMILVVGIMINCVRCDHQSYNPIMETQKGAFTSEEMMDAYLKLTKPESRVSSILKHSSFSHYNLGAIDEEVFN